MEVIVNREEVAAVVTVADYKFYGETSIFTFLFVTALLSNLPLFCIYFRSKHIRSVADK